MKKQDLIDRIFFPIVINGVDTTCYYLQVDNLLPSTIYNTDTDWMEYTNE